MVVPVLMTSCQVSEKANNGPVVAQTAITPTATPNAHEPPAHSVTRLANRSSTKVIEKPPVVFFLMIVPSPSARHGNWPPRSPSHDVWRSTLPRYPQDTVSSGE